MILFQCYYLVSTFLFEFVNNEARNIKKMWILWKSLKICCGRICGPISMWMDTSCSGGPDLQPSVKKFVKL